MKLENIAKKENYIYSERYVNRFKKVANEVSPKYCAIQGEESFAIPHLLLPHKEVMVITANPQQGMSEEFIRDGIVQFYIHPEMIEELNIGNWPLQWDTIVEPTASTRTVLPQDKEYFLKLHLNKRLSKYIRRLHGGSVQHSVLVSRELERVMQDCPATFGFLPESIGIAYHNIGMIVREREPRPIIGDERNVFPLFSLYSPDQKNKNDTTLFEQLVELHNVSPLDYFIDSILTPLFENTAHTINNYGLLLEPHGQNVLVEIDHDYSITRFIHRDFQSMYVDPKIRCEKELEMPFTKHIMGEECSRELSYSLVYDQFIGEYVLDEFCKLFEKAYGISQRISQQRIQEVFVEKFERSLFPTQGHYLLEKGRYNDNNVPIVFQDKEPKYRP